MGWVKSLNYSWLFTFLWMASSVCLGQNNYGNNYANQGGNNYNAQGNDAYANQGGNNYSVSGQNAEGGNNYSNEQGYQGTNNLIGGNNSYANDAAANPAGNYAANTVVDAAANAEVANTEAVGLENTLPVEGAEDPYSADGYGGEALGQTDDSQAQTEVVTGDVPPNSINLEPIGDPNDFAGVPPVPGTLRIMAEGEAPMSYTIQEGDTLFDICDQLLDESTYWPKLWSLNPDIKNPHFIWPGMILRFYPGDDLLPPFLEVQNEQDLVPIDKGGLTEADLVRAPLPEDEPDAVYVIDPIEVIDGSQVTPDSEDYIYAGTPRISTTMNITVPVFVFSEMKEEAGVVIGGAEGEINLGIGQTALVEVEDGVSPGVTYSVLRYTEEVENNLTRDFVGYKYQNAGAVKVEKLIEGGDKALVKVINSEFGVQKGDILVGYISSVRQVPVAAAPRSAPAADSTIVGFGAPNSSIGSQGQYVVLDNPGLAVGSNVGLYRAPVQFGDPTDGDYVPSELQSVGVARIVDSTDAASVGYILYATTALVKGDRTSPENLLEE